ncbi:hypothetical protein [Bradyrhizobium acaciae]|uniref:hypothetical protein n=1 Tax=Bradyrhizobium acaciae TaxID=2683706 RepID=UPI001E5BC6B7|nr:hypothetical protein [Bradyrhizobium acaciae]MCC8984550.1 hypothetical protein [Bradyrhizobium acaciae]
MRRDEKILIGKDVSKRVGVTPAKFWAIVTRRPKYRNRDGVVQAPAMVAFGFGDNRGSGMRRTPSGRLCWHSGVWTPQ